MARYKIIAQSNAVAGRDGDLERWYDGRHMPHMLAVPGFVSAGRFTLFGDGPYRHLAIDEIESDDIAATLSKIGTCTGTEATPIRGAIDSGNASVTAWPLAQSLKPLGSTCRHDQEPN